LIDLPVILSLGFWYFHSIGLGVLLYSSNNGIKAITRKKLERADKAFQVTKLLPSGRVLMHGAASQHAEKEFERIS
jgi:hypothetical protein